MDLDYKAQMERRLKDIYYVLLTADITMSTRDVLTEMAMSAINFSGDYTKEVNKGNADENER